MADAPTLTDDDARPAEQNLLTATPPALPDAKPGAKKKYWAYLAPDCPLPHIIAGAVTFHAEVELHGADGKTTPMPGQILELSDDDLQLVEDQLRESVLRSYYTIDERGRRTRRGQQIVSLFRTERVGVDMSGGPLLDATKKPITEKRLIPITGARTSPNDEPLVKYCRLEPVTRETEAVFARLSARAHTAAERIEEARRFNSVEAEKERSLAQEAGTFGRHSIMAREP